jgi:hypothetical protein
MLALADLVGLANPGGELLVQLLGRADAELVHHQALGIGRSPTDPRVLHAPLQVQIPVRAVGLGLAPAKPRRLPLKVIAVLETAYSNGPHAWTSSTNRR